MAHLSMTEKEKMLQGQIYNTRDPDLLRLYHKAKNLTQALNQLDSKDTAKKSSLLDKLLLKNGKDSWIESPFYCNYGSFISIGTNTFINMNCVFLDCNYITIGNNVLIGPNVQIYTADHPLKVTERLTNADKDSAPYTTFSKPVLIEDNVMIGGSSVILPGVKIGKGTCIGAGSIITKDLPEQVLAYGNPCRIIKNLK